MGRKKAADMTPEEREAYRAYMREAKRRSRDGRPPERDARVGRNRAAYMREYRRSKKPATQSTS